MQAKISYLFVVFCLLHLLEIATADNIELIEQCFENENDIDYGFCEGITAEKQQRVDIECISVTPWPIVFQPNLTISILAHVELKETVTEGSNFSVSMTKEADGVNISIPCLDAPEPWGKIGSCEYEGNNFINTFLPDFFCPNTKLNTTPPAPPTNCNLPLQAGHYGRQSVDTKSLSILGLYKDQLRTQILKNKYQLWTKSDSKKEN